MFSHAMHHEYSAFESFPNEPTDMHEETRVDFEKSHAPANDVDAKRQAHVTGLHVLINLVDRGCDVEDMLQQIDPKGEKLVEYLKFHTLQCVHADIEATCRTNKDTNVIIELLAFPCITKQLVVDALCYAYSPLLMFLHNFAVV